jgi:hypothetical protein
MTVSQRRFWQVVIVTFILFEVVVAAFGLELYFGGAIAPLMVMGSLILRLGVTFVVGAYLWALFGWDWPVWGAALFSAPALILMFPRLLTDFFKPQPV